MIDTDVCILGAGPGGVAAAMTLDKLGIPCYLLDKATFPRDKVCGDAVSGKVTWAFNKIDPTIFERFRDRKDIKVNCWGIRLIFPDESDVVASLPPDLSKIDIHKAKSHGFVCKRLDFDNFLVEEVRKRPAITFKEGIKIDQFAREANGLIMKDSTSGFQIKAKLVIAADGAQSAFVKKIAGIALERKHHAAAIRGYYKGVTGFDDHNFIELHFLKEFLPGYLWVFPLTNGVVNVGVAVRADLVVKNKIKLKKRMLELIETHPRFRDRFKNAEPTSPVVGFGIPLGSKKRQLSGNNYMLVGDAGWLVDPFSGEGIGNAVVSGQWAAEQAAQCLKEANFSAEFLQAYDKKVYKELWLELRFGRFLQKVFRFPMLIKVAAQIAKRSKNFEDLLTTLFEDINVNKKISSPWVYFKLLIKKHQSPDLIK